MGLFKPVWMTDKESKKAAALTFTERADQSTLLKIAREAPLLAVQIKAINRMTDQTALLSIINDQNLPDNLRLAAVKKILEKISDEGSLKSFVYDGTQAEELRVAAAIKIKDQAMVEAMMRNRSLPAAVRAAVINNASSVLISSDSNQELMRQMAREEKDTCVRIAAIHGIIPGYAEDLLRTLRDTVPELKKAACTRLNHEWGAGWNDGERLPNGKIYYECKICGAFRIDDYPRSGNTDSV